MFPLKCCISALPEFDQSLVDFFNLSDTRFIRTLLYDSLKSCNKCVQLGLLGALFRRKEVDSAGAVGLCYMHSSSVRCLLGFFFRKTAILNQKVLKHQTGEVGKQSIV